MTGPAALYGHCVFDTSALREAAKQKALKQLQVIVNRGLLHVPQKAGDHEASHQSSLKRWWEQYRDRVSAVLQTTPEHVRYQEVITRYGQRQNPRGFHFRGRTLKTLTDPDAFAVAIATCRNWTLVTEDESMAVVCRDIYACHVISYQGILALLSSPKQAQLPFLSN